MTTTTTWRTSTSPNADFTGCTGVTKAGPRTTRAPSATAATSSWTPVVVAKGEAGCSAFDGATANLFYCESSADVDCPAVTPAQIAAGTGPNGGEIKQCQNVARHGPEERAHALAGRVLGVDCGGAGADFRICKTRCCRSSSRACGTRCSTSASSSRRFGWPRLASSTQCYGGVFSVLGTQPIRFTHWMPGVPWSMMIFMYDETRKYMMRATSPAPESDAVTGADQAPGRLDRESPTTQKRRYDETRSPLPPPRGAI